MPDGYDPVGNGQPVHAPRHARKFAPWRRATGAVAVLGLSACMEATPYVPMMISTDAPSETTVFTASEPYDPTEEWPWYYCVSIHEGKAYVSDHFHGEGHRMTHYAALFGDYLEARYNLFLKLPVCYRNLTEEAAYSERLSSLRDLGDIYTVVSAPWRPR